jgi:hypothetical protein
MRRRVQSDAKKLIREIRLAGHLNEPHDELIAQFGEKHLKAVQCCTKEAVLSVFYVLYVLPAEHWLHLRNNPLEATFATARRRIGRTNGGGSRTAAMTMVRQGGSRRALH